MTKHIKVKPYICKIVSVFKNEIFLRTKKLAIHNLCYEFSRPSGFILRSTFYDRKKVKYVSHGNSHVNEKVTFYFSDMEILSVAVIKEKGENTINSYN